MDFETTEADAKTASIAEAANPIVRGVELAAVRAGKEIAPLRESGSAYHTTNKWFRCYKSISVRLADGTRWAKHVMPAVLHRLMRHESIDTTMAYYVNLDADELAEDLYRADEKRQESTVLGTVDRSAAGCAVRAGDSTPDSETSCKIGSGRVEPPTKGLWVCREAFYPLAPAIATLAKTLENKAFLPLLL
jgi:hypothetical protein